MLYKIEGIQKTGISLLLVASNLISKTFRCRVSRRFIGSAFPALRTSNGCRHQMKYELSPNYTQANMTVFYSKNPALTRKSTTRFLSVALISLVLICSSTITTNYYLGLPLFPITLAHRSSTCASQHCTCRLYQRRHW